MTLIYRVITDESPPRVIAGPYKAASGITIRMDFPAPTAGVTYSLQIQDDGSGTLDSIEEALLTGVRIRR